MAGLRLARRPWRRLGRAAGNESPPLHPGAGRCRSRSATGGRARVSCRAPSRDAAGLSICRVSRLTAGPSRRTLRRRGERGWGGVLDVVHVLAESGGTEPPRSVADYPRRPGRGRSPAAGQFGAVARLGPGPRDRLRASGPGLHAHRSRSGGSARRGRRSTGRRTSVGAWRGSDRLPRRAAPRGPAAAVAATARATAWKPWTANPTGWKSPPADSSITWRCGRWPGRGPVPDKWRSGCVPRA